MNCDLNYLEKAKKRNEFIQYCSKKERGGIVSKLPAESDVEDLLVLTQITSLFLVLSGNWKAMETFDTLKSYKPSSDRDKKKQMDENCKILSKN